MIELEIDYFYYEEDDSLDELDELVLRDENGGDQAIEYVRKDKATGDTSDGYHTFDELYEHRTGLLMALCNVLADYYLSVFDRASYEARLFKSRRHHDGSMYDGMFIVGINCAGNPKSEQVWATWHCEDRWWHRFNVPELDRAPEWDGHTPAEALARLVDAATLHEVTDE